MTRELTLAEIAQRIDDLRETVAHLITTLEERPSRAFANVDQPIAVSAARVAKILGVNRGEVYHMHRTGILNGFRPHPRAHMKFLVAEVRQVAEQMSRERRDADGIAANVENLAVTSERRRASGQGRK
ncbi:MAG TPA: hypothetical protein VNL91_09175 [Thermoanaerobaculia bacterium]|nr:hypothetical protein [Thermoanaerobaculia bacterium]